MTQQTMDQKDAVIDKLNSALAKAPRPDPRAGGDWMVQYMDWFFQMRLEALNGEIGGGK